MTIKLALTKLADDVRDLMATWAAARTAIERVTWTGTATTTLSGTPTAAGLVRVRFPTGGTIGVDGIFYQTSSDDGASWGTLTALGLATSIVFLGVTLALGAGTIVDDDVVRWTQSAPGTVPHRFGWRERTKHEGLRRIVWEPGDDGDVGEILPVKQPGRSVPGRPLWTVGELCAVYLEAVDQTDAATAENERAQYTAARLLFDLWARALYLVARGTVAILSIEWLDEKNVRRYGATLRVVVRVDAMVPDALQITLPTDATGHLETTVLDQTDTDDVSPTDTE